MKIMSKKLLFAVTEVQSHRDGWLLLPGISQDRFSNENFVNLNMGTEVELRFESKVVGFALVSTFAVPYDMNNSNIQSALAAPIGLVVRSEQKISIGTEVWIVESSPNFGSVQTDS